MSNKNIELLVNLEDINSDPQEVLQMTKQFVSDLNNSYLNVKADQLRKSDGSVSTKGDAFTLGALLLVTIPTILPQLLTFIQSWTIDRRKIIIETPNGSKVEFTSDKKYSEKDILELASKLNKIAATKK